MQETTRKVNNRGAVEQQHVRVFQASYITSDLQRLPRHVGFALTIMRVTDQAKVQLDDTEHFQLDQKVQVCQEESLIKRAPLARDIMSVGIRK